ncbi:MAG: SusC/RagA family TonB-linked outer membrane protein [Gemmatimonadetes bacterium]|nr:SusC/RagA family TonB-linked outer membrane protein [Gemmatimonadota bacterium]
MSKRILTFVMSVLLAAAGATGASAQQRQVSGTVTGPDQRPIAGATVTISGTSRGVQTDATGRYTISVPGGAASLTFRRIGLASRTIAVPAAQSSLDVRLQNDVLNLEAVVVTGQATAVRRENLANSVAVVSEQELQRAPAQTVEKALQGKVAGADISTNSGAPGGGVQIQLRGVSSIGGSADPLFVVDGVITSNVGIPSGQNAVAQSSRGVNSSASQDQLVNRMADINPNDIESIEILKGASASAIYGSKAANGVVIIRTKSGRAGAPRFTVGQRFGVYELSNKLGSRVWTRDEAVAFYHFDNETADRYFNADGTQRAVYDNEEAIFGRRDLSRITTASVSGGNVNTRYFVSALVSDEPGIIQNTGYEKQSALLKLDQTLGSRIRLGLSSNVIHSVASRGLTGNDNAGVSYYAVHSLTPSFFNLAARNADGGYVFNEFQPSNPVQTAALATNDEVVWRTITAGNLSVDLMKNDRQSLRFLANAGVDYFQQRNELFFPPTLQLETPGYDLDAFPGTAILGNGNNTNLNANVNLVHVLTPGSGAFTATTSVGTQVEDRDLQTSQIVGRNITVRIPSLGADVKTDGGRARARDFGAYIQEELLLFGERMNLTGSIRADRSSANADEAAYYFFPKAAASYRFGEIGSVLDDFKLRAAYGQSGNLPRYGQRFTSALGGTNLEGVVGIRVGGPVGSPDLKPERVTELEGGFDATLLNGNARFEFTAYNKRVTDFIIAPPLAPSTGFGAYTFNGGDFRNRGIEMMLEATPIRTSRVNWISRTTFAKNDSKVLRLDLPGENPTYRPGFDFGFDYGGYLIQEGKSPTALWGFREDSLVVLGDAAPDFRMGFSNDVSVGGFTLSALFDWAKGGMAANLTQSYFDDAGTAADFTGCGVEFTGCRGAERLALRDAGNSIYAEDAGFVKLREVSLSYELPSRLLAGRANSARLTLSGRNVKTWTNYSGLDPEVSQFGNRSVGRNIDVTPFPPNRSFWLGIDFGF